MTHPRVSVVMAVYNGGAHLAATLDSILGQTLTDFELVAVDDGSTDGTLPILATYARRDARIRIITQENRGLTRALIAGCAAAHAPLIARQDAGDLSHPHRLEKQARALEAQSVIFASCYTEFVGPELEPLYVARGGAAASGPMAILDLEQQYLVRDGPTCHPSVMFRRDAYERAGGYRAAFYYGQDWDLWYRLAALGTFVIVAEILYRTRVTPDSISGTARAAQQQFGVLSRAALRARLRGESEAPILARAAAVRPGRSGRRSRARGLYFIGEALRRNGDPRAREYFRRAIGANPLLARAWVRVIQAL